MTTTAPSSPTVRLGLPAPGGTWGVALPVLALAIAAVLFLYWSTAADMVGIWIRSATFTHAFLVPPISAWLLWRQRDRLAPITPGPNAWILLPMAGVAVLWLLGELASVNAITQLAFVAMLVLSVPAVLGLRFARAAAFPLAFLFFAVPLGEFLLPTLMQMTADFTVAALRLSGVPVFREGLMFVIPSGNWSVVEACSGVRYLIASFMVGTLYAYLMYRSTRRRLVFMGVALVMPLLANWVRAYLIVMLGHLSNNELATGVDHLIYGWLFFGFVIFLLFAIGTRWSEPPELALPARIGDFSSTARPVRRTLQTMGIVASAMVLVVAAPQWTMRAITQHESTIVPTLPTPTALGAGWTLDSDAASDWKPKLDNPSAVIDAAYRHEGGPAVGVHLAYFRQQGDLRKLGDSNSLLARSDDKRWSRVAGGRRPIAAGLRTIDVRTAELRNRDEVAAGPGNSVTAWQLYWVGGRFTSSDMIAKAYVALDRLLGRGDDSAELIVDVGGVTPDTADRLLESFMATNLPVLDALMTQVWRQR